MMIYLILEQSVRLTYSHQSYRRGEDSTLFWPDPGPAVEWLQSLVNT